MLPRQADVRRMILLLLCLALALTGCSALFGDLPGSSAGAGPGGTDGDAPIGGRGGGAVDPPGNGAVREVPDPALNGLTSSTIDRFEIGADGRTVIVYWWGGTPACYGLADVMVGVQRGTPIFTVVEGRRPGTAEMACTEELVLKSTVVTLEAPILADAAGHAAPAGEPNLPADPTAVAVRPGVLDPRPHAISGYGLSADGLTLSVHYAGGVEDCNGLAEAAAQRDADGLVTVTIREGRVEPSGDCIEIALAKVVELTLEQPLIIVGAFNSEGPSTTY